MFVLIQKVAGLKHPPYPHKGVGSNSPAAPYCISHTPYTHRGGTYGGYLVTLALYYLYRGVGSNGSLPRYHPAVQQTARASPVPMHISLLLLLLLLLLLPL